jgi:hypothetical protein
LSYKACKVKKVYKKGLQSRSATASLLIKSNWSCLTAPTNLLEMDVVQQQSLLNWYKKEEFSSMSCDKCFAYQRLDGMHSREFSC